MFIGHFAVGLAAKRIAPAAPLSWLLAAPLLLDLLWPLFLLTGVESMRVDPSYSRVMPLDLHDYPYSHSLAGALLCTLLFALLYLLVRRDRRGAVVVAAGVFSHWFLDWLTHPPDMPLYPGSQVGMGLGLWNSLAGTLIVEGALWVGAVWLYARTTRASRPGGAVGLWGPVAVLTLLYLGSVFGPPPPSPTPVMVLALGAWLFPLWAAWLERRRTLRPA